MSPWAGGVFSPPECPPGSVPVPLLLPATSVAAEPLHCEAPCLESLLLLVAVTGGEEESKSSSCLTSSLGGKKKKEKKKEGSEG